MFVSSFLNLDVTYRCLNVHNHVINLKQEKTNMFNCVLMCLKNKYISLNFYISLYVLEKGKKKIKIVYFSFGLQM